MLKRKLTTTLCWLICWLFTTAAMAQQPAINVVPQVGMNWMNLRQYTYSAAIKALVPAASTTDFFCIDGSASKKIHINRWEVSGTGTLGSFPVYLNHNLGLSTGTKAVAATYGPVPVALNSTEPAATATLVAYNTTGGVATVGGVVTNIRTGVLLIGASATYTSPIDRLVWDFGTRDEFYNMRLDIPAGATTEQYCLNLVAASPTAVLEGYIEWTEE